MPYTTDEGGLLNNFAREPKIYQSEPATASQKRNLLIVAVVACVLVGGLIAVAFSVS
ncbi:photosystem II assembly protein Psb34 [Calothrix sp. 336/3]|uniref:photosystem II assembly protein Psb34 n=1 Tax=Calothrix sp. 336/3 TaxID=1337936 RepID=UPI000AD70F82|nr:ssl1498 family light-harvesting-like protein [Calothrix sp. 336/3]